jgi:tetratricopeptide (TPR) repeat protein
MFTGLIEAWALFANRTGLSGFLLCLADVREDLKQAAELQGSEQALNTALKLAPESAEAQFQLGVVLYFQGNYRPAETLFRSAAEAKPDFAAAHYNLGHCLLQKGDRRGASRRSASPCAARPTTLMRTRP